MFIPFLFGWLYVGFVFMIFCGIGAFVLRNHTIATKENYDIPAPLILGGLPADVQLTSRPHHFVLIFAR